MEKNTIKGHGFKVGDLVDYYGRDESATDQADRAILSKEGTVYVLTVVGGEFDGTRVAKFGAASKIWAAPANDERVSSPAPVATEPVFSETDASTWSNAPAGYEWREVDAVNGELHLFAPDGRNVSEACYAAASAVPVSVGDMVEDIDAERTFVITRADEYWIGMREVGTWRECRNIRTPDFRKHLADGALVVVNERPSATVAVFADTAGDAFDFTQDDVTRRITVVNWEGGERGHYVCFVDTQGDRGSLHSNAWNMAMAMGDLVKITDGAPDFIMALVDQDMKLRGHAAPQDARTAVISAPVRFRLGRGKRKASKRQARRNRGVSK